MAKGKLCHTFYETLVKVCRDVLYVVKDESSNLRYKWLTHIRGKGFQILAKGKTLNPCNHCLFGKQHKLSFAISSQKKSNHLELVYFDVCGSIEVSVWVPIDILSHLLMMHQGRCGEFVEEKRPSVQPFQQFQAMVN